jgi:hypothetical protein
MVFPLFESLNALGKGAQVFAAVLLGRSVT